MLSGILTDMFKNHQKGLFWNGELTLEDMEVTNSSRFAITKKPSRYDLGHGTIPLETRQAFAKDLLVIPEKILPKIPGIAAIPHSNVFQNSLSEPDLELMSNLAIMAQLHAFLLHNPMIKPPIAVLNLFSGIHRACRSHDLGDPTAPYRDLLEDNKFGESNSFGWMEKVENSKNTMLNDVLQYPKDEPGIINKPKLYEETFRSFSDYMRHLENHSMDHTFSKRRRIEGADGLKVDEKEPREQHVKLHDEIAIAAAIHLSEVICATLLLLLKNFAITGMLETHWEVYQSCSYTTEEDLEDDIDWF